MKGIILFSLMAAGFILFAGIAIGVNYTKYDEVTTTVTIDDGITCTINGKEVSNGDTVTVSMDLAKMNVCVKSDYDQPIGYVGSWTSGSDTVTSSQKDSSVSHCGKFVINFNHGSYTGSMKIKFFAGDEMQTISMKFHISSDVTVTIAGTQINDGDSYDFKNDIKVSVSANDGQKHNISYSYWWGKEKEHPQAGKTVVDFKN